MRTISLWQPWASLWCSPHKIHETRDWPTKHRGWLLVHASKKMVKQVDLDLADILAGEFGGCWASDLPVGAIIGAVNIVNCRRTDELAFNTKEAQTDYVCGNFAPGRYAWERGEWRQFAKQIPYRGAQGFFSVDLEEIGIKHMMPEAA